MPQWGKEDIRITGTDTQAKLDLLQFKNLDFTESLNYQTIKGIVTARDETYRHSCYNYYYYFTTREAVYMIKNKRPTVVLLPQRTVRVTEREADLVQGVS